MRTFVVSPLRQEKSCWRRLQPVFKLYEIRGLIMEEFEGLAKVTWVIQNVSSLDVAARDEISSWLGVSR